MSEHNAVLLTTSPACIIAPSAAMTHPSITGKRTRQRGYGNVSTVFKRLAHETTAKGRVKLTSAHGVKSVCAECGAHFHRLNYTLHRATRSMHTRDSCPGIYHYHSLEAAALARQPNETVFMGFSDCTQSDHGGGCARGTYFTPGKAVSLDSLERVESAYYGRSRRVAES